jgi:hypothetical protein
MVTIYKGQQLDLKIISINLSYSGRRGYKNKFSEGDIKSKGEETSEQLQNSSSVCKALYSLQCALSNVPPCDFHNL